MNNNKMQDLMFDIGKNSLGQPQQAEPAVNEELVALEAKYKRLNRGLGIRYSRLAKARVEGNSAVIRKLRARINKAKDEIKDTLTKIHNIETGSNEGKLPDLVEQTYRKIMGNV